MGAEDWHDPHDLIPEQFQEEFGDSETVADALQRARSRPSSTPNSERPCCPRCCSLDLTPKSNSSMSATSQRLEGDWKCLSCGEHFGDPDDYNPEIMDAHATDFNWLGQDDLDEPDDRSQLVPPLGGVDDETLAELVLRIYRPWTDSGPSYRDLAPFIPHSRKWIGDRVRAWKAGEYRELVPDPTEDERDPAPNNEPRIDPSVAVARIGGDYGELVAERTGSIDASSDGAAVATDGGRRRRRWGAYGSD